MRDLSLWILADRFGASGDAERWYEEARKKQQDQLLTWLVEAPDDAEKFYTLTPDEKDASIAILEAHDLKEPHRDRLPFNQPTGSQSAALGPIIKRTFANKKSGPSKKTQDTTLAAFAAIAAGNHPWSSYFSEALDCFTRPRLHNAITGATTDTEAGALNEAIATIAEKRTVLLSYKTPAGELPGDLKSYQAYLMEVLATTKYTTSKAPQVANQICALCGKAAVVLPNAIKGAGINLANIDREGAFPGLAVDDAWKHFSLCGACADLLYIYSFHFSNAFIARVAGENALVVPSLAGGEPQRVAKFTKKFQAWVKSVRDGEVKSRENSLLKLLAESDAVTELVFLWADFGQRIDNVRGVVSDVLPSRLRELDTLNAAMTKIACPAFPDRPVEQARFDLALSFLGSMLHRRGGKKAKRENESRRLFDLKRTIAAAVYRHETINPVRFWDEFHKTATWYLMDVVEDRNWGHLLYEGVNRKGESYLTFAGWVRHLAMILNYFRTTGVLPMSGEIYEPACERLKPYFTDETAIDTKAKAYAFILGVLYGKVMQVQAARGVNVGANALTWLKRLTLRGSDLPELYIKVREKLLAYETEGSSEVREIVHELGELGSKTNSLLELGETDACYFLLLGQSLATKILPKKEKPGDTADTGAEATATS